MKIADLFQLEKPVYHILKLKKNHNKTKLKKKKANQKQH